MVIGYNGNNYKIESIYVGVNDIAQSMENGWVGVNNLAKPFGAKWFMPFSTGSHAVFGDETQGRIELYETGEVTLSRFVTYDAFVVGGGGGGSTGGGGGAVQTREKV